MIKVFLAAASLIVSGMATAGDCTTIAKVPVSISQPGKYCLTANVATASVAVNILSNDVELDCKGHVIDGSSVPSNAATIGIRASGRNNLTIRGCTIKGFAEGIAVNGTGNSVLENTVLASLGRGIRVYGENNQVNDNRVMDIAGTTAPGLPVSGIYIRGTTDVRSNTVSGVVARTGSGEGAYGIYSTANDAGAISGNTVRNLVADGSGTTLGITLHDSINAVMIDNQASNPDGTNGYAFYCSGQGSVAAGNVAQGFLAGISPSCIDGGGNLTP